MSARSKIILLAAMLVLASSCVFAGHEAQKANKAQGKDDLYNQVELFSDAVSGRSNSVLRLLYFGSVHHARWVRWPQRA